MIHDQATPGRKGHDLGTARVPTQNLQEALANKGLESLGLPGHAGHAENDASGLTDHSAEHAPATPYRVPLPAGKVATVLANVKGIIQTLANLVRWLDELRANVLDRLRRHPASSIAGDFEHFRDRLASAQAGVKVAALARRTCGTCAHRSEHPAGVKLRCARARALFDGYRARLEFPEQTNDCAQYEKKERELME